MNRLFAALLLPAIAIAATGRANVVLIVSDEQGYANISCYPHPDEVSTPNLDCLATEGVRMTSGYASCPVCAPTRAGLLTGRYQQRFGFCTAADSRAGLPRSETTLAELLRNSGYATGVFGKWYVGYEQPYWPLERGFDTFYGFLGHGGHDYFELSRTDAIRSISRDREPIDDTGYLTRNITAKQLHSLRRTAITRFLCTCPITPSTIQSRHQMTTSNAFRTRTEHATPTSPC